MTRLTTLEVRRTRADMVEVYKILRGQEGLDESAFFTRLNSSTRGHAMKLFKESVRKDTLKYSFGNRVINMWNKLPEKVVNSEGINPFKRGLDLFLRNF